MPQRHSTGPFAGPGVMLLSVAIFGYFGYGVTWLTSGVNGQFLLYVAILEWTLKVSAVAFLLAAIITFVHGFLGNLVYCIVGLLGAIAMAVVFILDLKDPQHMAMTPILLIIFAAWNGYGAWTGLQELLAYRSASSKQAFTGPGGLPPVSGSG